MNDLLNTIRVINTFIFVVLLVVFLFTYFSDYSEDFKLLHILFFISSIVQLFYSLWSIQDILAEIAKIVVR